MPVDFFHTCAAFCSLSSKTVFSADPNWQLKTWNVQTHSYDTAGTYTSANCQNETISRSLSKLESDSYFASREYYYCYNPSGAGYVDSFRCEVKINLAHCYSSNRNYDVNVDLSADNSQNQNPPDQSSDERVWQIYGRSLAGEMKHICDLRPDRPCGPDIRGLTKLNICKAVIREVEPEWRNYAGSLHCFNTTNGVFDPIPNQQSQNSQSQN